MHAWAYQCPIENAKLFTADESKLNRRDHCTPHEHKDAAMVQPVAKTGDRRAVVREQVEPQTRSAQIGGTNARIHADAAE